MWVVGIELLVALPLVLIVWWALRAGAKHGNSVITTDETGPQGAPPSSIKGNAETPRRRESND